MNDDQPRNYKPLIYVVVAIALVAAAWAARPLYREWKKQRYLGKAETFIQKSDYRNAALCARQVLTLDRANIQAVKLLCEITARIHSPDLVTCRQMLVDLQPNNPTNHIALAEAALTFGDTTRAEQSLLRVPAANRDNLAFHQTAAFILASQHKLSEAEAHFNAALKLAPTNTLLRINHAVILMQARDSNIVADAVKTLEQHINDPANGRVAKQNLTQGYLVQKQYDKAVTLARELTSMTNATFADELLLLSIMHQAGRPDYDATLAAMETKAAASPDQIRSLANWLASSKQSTRALQWLTNLPANTQTDPRVAVCIADGWLATQNWSGLQRTTATGNWAEAEFARYSLQAKAWHELGQNISSDAAWLNAVKAAGNRPHIIAQLARQANSWGWTREEQELLWQIVERFPGEKWAPSTLSELLTKTGNTRGLNRLAGIMAGQNSANVAAQNDLAVTSLLLNIQLANAHETARNLYGKYPSNAVIASTFAFSLYTQGKFDEARRAFSGISPAALEQPGVALYYGLVLGTNSPAEARKYLHIAVGNLQLPEEKALAEDALKRL
ncbi:MAG: hypothetical protein RLY20_3034 [Verrucomicrobiota bacterium]|jgi:predicted Zn-dependent protease